MVKSKKSSSRASKSSRGALKSRKQAKINLFDCLNCGHKLELPIAQLPTQEKNKCVVCGDYNFAIQILSNNGNKKWLPLGQYLSLKNAGHIKRNDEGVEVWHAFEEIEKEDEDKEKISIQNVADSLIKEYFVKTILGEKNDEVYYYNGSIYDQGGKGILRQAIEKLLGESCTNHRVIEILEKVKRLTAIDREEFDTVPISLIPLGNCIYDIKNNQTIEYSPEFHFKFKIPVNYVENSKCRRFKKFLKETLCPNDIQVIQEWFGFCLYRKYAIKKGIIFIGEKDTAKTVLLNVLMALIGKKNTSGLSLQRISSNDKFGLSALYKKLANVFDDLQSKDIGDVGGFKIATGGGYITAEYKFGESFQFMNFAKLIFACNKIPPIKDIDDNAYFDRWMPIEFLNVVEEKDMDIFLTDKLTSKKELEGILIWALEGLRKLLKNGKFSFDKTEEQVKKIMLRSGNSLFAFVQDCLEKSEDGRITKEEMYQIYSWWAEQNKATRLSKEQLGRQLEKHAPFITAKTGKERYWLGSMCKLDTLDTILKNIRYENKKEKKEKQKFIYIKKNEVSKVSKQHPNIPKKLCQKCNKKQAIIIGEGGKNYCEECAK